MVKLLFFEFRKHFLNKSILIAVLLFSVLNVVKIYSVYDESSLLSQRNSPGWKDLYWEMYGEFSGRITSEKIDKLMSIYQPLYLQTADKTASTASDNPNTYTGNVYEDAYFFQWNFVDPMEYFYMYSSYADEVVDLAKENLALFQSIGNHYEYKMNEAVVERFEGRFIPDFSYTEMYKNFFHYDFSSFLVILICLFALVNVFVSEKETEMELLLLTTKQGGTQTVWAKLISSTIFVCVVCAWFWIIDFIAFSTIFGTFEGTFSPIYAIENFANASININLGQYAMLSYFVKTLGILVLSFMFLLVSIPFKRTIFPYIISFMITFGLIYILEVYSGSSRILEKVINPFVLIVNRELFGKTEFINFFGYPLISYNAALIFAGIWGLLCIFAILILIRKNAVRNG